MKRLAFAALALATCVGARAQFLTDFEAPAYSGSASGVVAAGQQGWYLPAVTGTIDGNIYTYAGNALGLSSNPMGGSQFLGGQSAGGTAIVRAQHDLPFASPNPWTMTFDFNGKYNGTLPSLDNLGSASLQPSASSNYFQTIYQWAANTVLADKFDANYGVFTSTGQTGGGAGIAFMSPGAAWQGLPVNHWFRQSTTWDFGTNLITEVSLQDLTLGTGPVTANPTGWYLAGGAANFQALATPSAVRFFVGGGAGNAMGYDNLSIVPEPATIAVLAAGLVGAALRRRKR